MASSPWNKRFLSFLTKQNIPPPESQTNEIATTNTPIALKLSGSELVYENGSWRQGDLNFVIVNTLGY